MKIHKTVQIVGAPKKCTCLTIQLHGLEWVVFTFCNIRRCFLSRFKLKHDNLETRLGGLLVGEKKNKPTSKLQ